MNVKVKLGGIAAVVGLVFMLFRGHGFVPSVLTAVVAFAVVYLGLMYSQKFAPDEYKKIEDRFK